MAEQPDLIVLWRNIVQAGGIPAWVDAQLTARGLFVTRRDASERSNANSEGYKKELKAEAEERRKLRKQAWQGYKANHIVHLGEGVFWKDAPGPDKWDVENAEERAAENELPLYGLAPAVGRSVGADPVGAALVVVSPRRRHEHPLPAFPDSQARRRRAGHLGAIAEAEGGPAVDSPQHRRETAGPRGRPWLSAGSINAHQRRRTPQSARPHQGRYQGFLSYGDGGPRPRASSARQVIASKWLRCSAAVYRRRRPGKSCELEG